MTNTYEPGVYVKGDSEKVANSTAAAVALVFDGYKRKGDATAAEHAPVEIVNSGTSATPDIPTPGSLFGSQKDGDQ